MTPEQLSEIQNSEILPFEFNETDTAKDTITDEHTEKCDVCGAEFHGTIAKAQLGRYKSAKHSIVKGTQGNKTEQTQSTKEQVVFPADYQLLVDSLKRWGLPKSSEAMIYIAIIHLMLRRLSHLQISKQ